MQYFFFETLNMEYLKSWINNWISNFLKKI